MGLPFTAATAAVLFCLPRLGYLWLASPDDPSGTYYWVLSEGLLRWGVLGSGGVPSTGYEPLYPAFLAAARWLTGDSLHGVMVLQVALGSLGAACFYRFCQRQADEPTARIAVLVFCFHPYLVRQSASAIEITVVATLLIAAAACFSRMDGVRGAAVAGVAFGITLLARAAVLPVLVMCLLFLAWKRRYAQALAVAIGAALVVLPMALRNHAIDGSLLPTRGGLNLYVANNPYADQVIPAYNTDLLQEHADALARQEAPRLLEGPEPGLDAFYRDKAVEWMAGHPLRTLQLKLSNVAYFFSPRIVPYQAVDAGTRLEIAPDGTIRVDGLPERSALVEWGHAVFCGLLLAGALAGAWVRRRQAGRDAVLYFMLLGFAAVCALFFPATRLRAPVEFVLVFFAACAAARCLRRA